MVWTGARRRLRRYYWRALVAQRVTATSMHTPGSSEDMPRIRRGCRLLLLVLLAHSTGLFAQSTTGGATEIRVHRRDAIRIMVWGMPDFTGDFEVLADGRLAHPLLKDIPVEGRTFTEIRADIEAVLEQFQKNPQVIVTPLYRLSVGGSVSSPGIVSIDPRATLVELLGTVGGPSPSARVEKAYLVRTGERYQVQLWGGSDSQRTLLDMGLRSGDQVFFPEERNLWRSVIVPFSTIAGTIMTIANFIYLVNR